MSLLFICCNFVPDYRNAISITSTCLPDGTGEERGGVFLDAALLLLLHLCSIINISRGKWGQYKQYEQYEQSLQFLHSLPSLHSPQSPQPLQVNLAHLRFAFRAFLDTQVSLAPTHIRCPSVGHTFGFPFCQRISTVTERPQRFVTFETFGQSDEGK